MSQNEFSRAEAHRFFSASCFNGAWEIIGQRERGPQDEERLIARVHASHYHWMEREDCTPRNLAVAHWLLSRAYAVVGQAEPARRYARLSLQSASCEGVPAYYRGCARAALARAAQLCGDESAYERERQRSLEIADALEDESERQMLFDDLDSI